ncbi:MAG: site-2 protease family protein [Candidatus Micrarchaeota archaeon]|nr:site-2 protease family protein [Candidatus Micrarchaeota archaeon]MDE1834200.1 site-2 protease family protein [Candidatus Micrarchaeota archaeon]MDE1859084.1 site-2 protease family protein [Candidatus Micrarchaeota archaeon]
MEFSFSRNSVVADEIKDIVIADVALAIAFAFLFTGGITNFAPDLFLFFMPIALVTSSLTFVLHEYMHKIVAQRFGATAAFRRSDVGLMLTLLSGAFGFLMGLPGATMIYTNRFTREEDGYVSLAGPLTNFAIFLVFYAIFIFLFKSSPYIVLTLWPSNATSVPYLELMLAFTLFISAWLAFFNMLPIYPLDGSKVFRWNKLVYFVAMAAIFIFLYSIVGPGLVIDLVVMLIIAFFISVMFSGMRLF